MKHILTALAMLALSLLPAAAQSTDAEALAFLKKHAPKVHAQIVVLEKAEPADYRDALADARKAAAEFAKLETARDAAATAAYLKMYELDFEAIGVADDIVASTDAAETERLTKRLRGLLDASFEQWAIVEQARIARLEKELAALKQEHATAVANRAKVVDGDTAKLIEESRAFQKSKRAK